ncbi:MAG: polysaccharide biosynthesis C-terminal domain-containing protein, partial [Candidatus Bathyarchaeia archaeon]
SAARFLMFLVLYFMVRGMVKVVIPWKNIAKYVFASLIMGCLIYWLNLKLQLTRVHQILGLTAFAGVFYLALLMSIDEDARTLAKLAWQEIKGALEAI